MKLRTFMSRKNFERTVKVGMVCAVLLIVMLPIVASAHTTSRPLAIPYWGGQNDPLLPCVGAQCQSLCDLVHLFQHLIWFGITLVVLALAPAFIAFGGIMMMISIGSPEKLGSSKRIVTSAIVGLLIALGAFIIVNTFMTFLVPGVNWTTISCTYGT